MARALSLALVCLTLAALPVAAWELPVYREVVWAETDGSRAVAVTIEVPSGAPATITLPLAYKACRVTKVAPGGVTARVDADAGAAELVLENISVPGPVEIGLDVRGDAPKVTGWSNRAFAHELVNTAQVAIATYRADLMLPEGFGISSIDDTIPEGSGGGQGPVELVRDGRRRGVRLVAQHVGAGDRVAVRLRYRPDRRSPLVAGVLGALALAYLVAFRGLVRKGEASREGEGG